MAQRRIWKRGKTDWELAEIGTEGTHKLPATAEEGEYFNDVTGARDPDIQKVRAGLVDHMMLTGSLQTDRDLDLGWTALSKRLVAAAEEARGLKRSVSPLSLGDMILVAGKEEGTHTVSTRALKDIDAGLVSDAGDFVFDFMDANGQLAYIERQPWYRDGSFEVHVDLNFYYDREIEAKGLGTHKDTGGDNLFVNLIFDNELDTPATEWTQDPQPLLGFKADLMKKLLPKDMLEQIALAKERLKTLDHAQGHEFFEGGTMPPHAFVSWVDELVWHSSPFLGRRPRYGSAAMRGFFHDNLEKDPKKLTGYLFQMSGKPGNLVHARRQKLEAEGRAFDIEACQALVAELLKEADGRDRLLNDVGAFGWETSPSSGHIGNDIDKDPRIGMQTSHTPTDAFRRPRANSFDKIREEALKAKVKQPRRSFLRTWIRVVKAPSGKL